MHAACTRPAPHALAPLSPGIAPPCEPRRDSAGRDGVQPATELRHVQRDGHEPNVLRAPPARAIGILPGLVLRARRAHLLSPPPHALVPPVSPSMSLGVTRQISALNQPLSFDTSKVTAMQYMFQVRSARALTFSRGPPRACRLRRRHPTSSGLPAHTPRPTSHAFVSTRQGASAFNQPLSWNTSSVTTMRSMFYVRSAHALAPSAFTAGPSRRACCS